MESNRGLPAVGFSIATPCWRFVAGAGLPNPDNIIRLERDSTGDRAAR